MAGWKQIMGFMYSKCVCAKQRNSCFDSSSMEAKKQICTPPYSAMLTGVLQPESSRGSKIAMLKCFLLRSFILCDVAPSFDSSNFVKFCLNLMSMSGLVGKKYAKLKALNAPERHLGANTNKTIFSVSTNMVETCKPHTCIWSAAFHCLWPSLCLTEKLTFSSFFNSDLHTYTLVSVT